MTSNGAKIQIGEEEMLVVVKKKVTKC